METIILSIVFIFFMAGVFLTWFFIHKAKTKERLLLIEKGIELPQLSKEKYFLNNFPWLKVGIVAAFIGMGIIFGAGNQERGIATGWVFLFGGIGMVIANYVGKPKVEK
jgi:hypothetical protein